MASFFLQMFKRGRYVSRRPSDADETKEEQENAERERKECERFAVAAVAFCIKHDEAFKRHFLDVVAKLSPEVICKVTPEPKLHTDLVLEGNLHVLVLEFKIDAQLEEHQNPEEPAFWEEKGYGTKICETFRQQADDGKELRYIVVGKEFDGRHWKNRDARKFDRLKCSSVLWSALIAEGHCENGIEEDLYDCLGGLGVTALLLRHMKTKPRYTDDAKQGMAVYQFLKRVLEVEGGGLRAGRADNSDRAIGLSILSAGGGSLRRKLIEVTQPKGQLLGWIGYGNDDIGVPRPEIEFYCSQKAAQAEICNRMDAVKGLGKTKEAGSGVWIYQEGDGFPDDAEWFKKVLKTVAGI